MILCLFVSFPTWPESFKQTLRFSQRWTGKTRPCTNVKHLSMQVLQWLSREERSRSLVLRDGQKKVRSIVAEETPARFGTS